VDTDSDTQYMLTTVDNPWNPFTNYDEWYQFDMNMGYDTTGLLARIAIVSVDTSDSDFELAIQSAIDEVCEQNVSGVHRKVAQT
jgi:hypothetical protein